MVAPGFQRFRHSSKGYRAILLSDGVREDLQARADRVKRAAAGSVPGDVELIADTQAGQNRVGATVIGVPMRIEPRRRVLGSAIDAAK